MKVIGVASANEKLVSHELKKKVKNKLEQVINIENYYSFDKKGVVNHSLIIYL